MKTWLCTHCERTFTDCDHCPHCGAREDFELILDTTTPLPAPDLAEVSPSIAIPTTGAGPVGNEGRSGAGNPLPPTKRLLHKLHLAWQGFAKMTPDLWRQDCAAVDAYVAAQVAAERTRLLAQVADQDRSNAQIRAQWEGKLKGQITQLRDALSTFMDAVSNCDVTDKVIKQCDRALDETATSALTDQKPSV